MAFEATDKLRHAVAEREKEAGIRLVIFHREGGWYQLELPLTDDLGEHARHNPGTLKITHAITQDVLWPLS